MSLALLVRDCAKNLWFAYCKSRAYFEVRTTAIFLWEYIFGRKKSAIDRSHMTVPRKWAEGSHYFRYTTYPIACQVSKLVTKNNFQYIIGRQVNNGKAVTTVSQSTIFCILPIRGAIIKYKYMVGAEKANVSQLNKYLVTQAPFSYRGSWQALLIPTRMWYCLGAPFGQQKNYLIKNYDRQTPVTQIPPDPSPVVPL